MSTPDPNFTADAKKALAFTPHVYDLHGNIKFMHCIDEEAPCSKNFKKCPTMEEFMIYRQKVVEEEGELVASGKALVPKCETCGKDMKPHCMFFDESYSEHYYRKDSVAKFVDEADCLIVVGTALATSMANRLVENRLFHEKPVIEINLVSSIDKGNNIQVLGRADQTLPELFKEYYRLSAED